MKRSQRWFIRRSIPKPKTKLTGLSPPSPRIPNCPGPTFIASEKRSACNLIANATLNSQQTCFFVEKVRDILGLYLNPPNKVMVLCGEEKSQIQALDRTQPLLPMGLGYAEGVTRDYVRHRTTTLFAALDIATGHVFIRCKARHRHQEYLDFLKHVDINLPRDLDIHLVVDNYATHKHAYVKRWLAANPRTTFTIPQRMLMA
jgi:transposase